MVFLSDADKAALKAHGVSDDAAHLIDVMIGRNRLLAGIATFNYVSAAAKNVGTAFDATAFASSMIEQYTETLNKITL